MTTPFIPIDVGSVVTVTASNSIANNAYANAADVMTITASDTSMLVDFELSVTWATAPVAGMVSLIASDYSLDDSTAGPVPSATLPGRLVGNFDPQPRASNAATTILMRLSNVSQIRKCNYYLLNNGTGQTISTGWVLKAQRWTPGT